MTDTPQPGAADAAHVTPPRPPNPPLHPSYGRDWPNPGEVVVSTSALLPQFTALVRWLMHGVGIWLIAHGMEQSRAAGLELILTGLTMSLGALGWSFLQKEWAKERTVVAAKADPARVVLK